MPRICPSCKSVLGYYDVYFCSSCGNALPEELIKKTKVQTAKVVKIESHSKFSSLDAVTKFKPLIISLAPFLLIGALLFVGFVLYEKYDYMTDVKLLTKESNPQKVTITTVPINSNNTLKVETLFLDGNFDLGEKTSYVPADVDLYIEGSDLGQFAEKLILSNPNLDQNFLDFYKNNKTQLNSSFIMFVKKNTSGYSYGFVVSTSSSKPVVVTNDSEMSKISSDVSAGIEKGIALNPVYASAKSSTPNTGQFLIAVTGKSGRAFLYYLLEQKLPQEFVRIINKFLDSKLDYAVILKG